LTLSACFVNTAKGDMQFTALMTPEGENKTCAEEHKQIVATYGVAAESDPAQIYLSGIGKKVAAYTERPDVSYKFFLLDTPLVNAFAVPGGYVYVTRGLMAQANSESELAFVLAHEIGHITARHSAEQYSRGVVTSLGAALISSAIGGRAAAQALNLGSDLYLKSYSRAQETQADELGVRYGYRAGYSPYGMAAFLQNLDAASELDAKLAGGKQDSFVLDYFATHPKTADRVTHAMAEAAKYPANDAVVGHDEYLRHIDGLVYGDSARQGFIKDNRFYHAPMDFTFAVPDGFKVSNQPAEIIVTGPDGGIILIDTDSSSGESAADYMSKRWMKDTQLKDMQQIVVGGREAATASFAGHVAGYDATIMIYAVKWADNRMFRFQIAVPAGADSSLYIDAVSSLRQLTAAEKANVRPMHIRVFTAGAGDTAQNIAAALPFRDLKTERFTVLNGLKPGDKLQPGQLYKTIVSD
jgi:predicted Zn-dependent protease